MKTAAFLAAAATATTAYHTEEEYQTEFTKWMHVYDKAYSADEFFSKYNIFKANYDKIEAHNEGNHDYSMKVNQFADLTADEFKAIYYGLTPRSKSKSTGTTVFKAPEGYKARADGVDWRTKNAVTNVKNQGQCGSCWSFSTTGSMEGFVAINSGKLTPLSESELVDCAGSEGNQGCNGGLMDDAFAWIQKNGGLCSEADYPYRPRDSSCKKSDCTNVAGTNIGGHTDVDTNEKALAAAVDNLPISIAIEADQSSFQFYSGGIMNGRCGKQLDHGVLAVGYGTQGTKDYWIVKNSWGADWGESGYIRIGRGKDLCGIADGPPSFPTK